MRVSPSPVEERTDHEGRVFDSVTEMLDFYNVKSSTYQSRKSKGRTLEECLTGIGYGNADARTDHTGRVFKSVKDMCKFHNVSYTSYVTHINNGTKTKREILTHVKPPISRLSEEDRTDFNGKVWETKGEMCLFYGVSTSALDDRLRRGWSLKKALTTSVTKPKSCEDHLGNKYKTTTEMCRHYGISPSVFNNRQLNGWSLEKTLTTPIKSLSKKCKDHLGNEFNSIKEMCEYHNADIKIYHARKAMGWALKDILTVPVNSVEKCKDHLGNEFDCQSLMCDYWKVPYKLFESRIRKGWTLEEALTIKRGERNDRFNPCEDHLGNKFKCWTEMCDYWNMDYSTFKYRIKNGWKVQEALLTPIISNKKYGGWRCISFVYESDDKVLYFLCRKGNQEEVLSRTELEAKVK